jgi:transposase InsO family protein
MPWKVVPMSEIRLAFVHQVVSVGTSVAEACRVFGISRKTGHKWLRRYQEEPTRPLANRSRRPHGSPWQTDEAAELCILAVRRRFGWGPQKIHDYLRARGVPLPSSRTVANVLRRRGCLNVPPVWASTPQAFERGAPHELWQCDFKGPLEVARHKIHPFAVLDDHSRYLLALRPCTDLTMATAFAVLWDAFGEFGLPHSLLCDNAFSTRWEVPRTPSWFEAQLIRLGIHPLHGKPYHPQTQGKVERLNGTLERELWPRVRRDSLPHFHEDLDRWRLDVYNSIRPHEALGGKPPITRFTPSPRPRPSRLPDLDYPPGSLLRKVSTVGDIRWKKFRILAGRGLVGQLVRLEERPHELALFYAWKQIRALAYDQLQPDTML